MTGIDIAPVLQTGLQMKILNKTRISILNIEFVIFFILGLSAMLVFFRIFTITTIVKNNIV